MKTNDILIQCPVCHKEQTSLLGTEKLNEIEKIKATCCFCNFTWIVTFKKKKKKPNPFNENGFKEID